MSDWSTYLRHERRNFHGEWLDDTDPWMRLSWMRQRRVADRRRLPFRWGAMFHGLAVAPGVRWRRLRRFWT